jgi:hypothetical protein
MVKNKRKKEIEKNNNKEPKGFKILSQTGIEKELKTLNLIN